MVCKTNEYIKNFDFDQMFAAILTNLGATVSVLGTSGPYTFAPTHANLETTGSQFEEILF